MIYTIDGYLLSKAKEQLAEEALRRLRKQLAHAHRTCDELLRSSETHREELVTICTIAGVTADIAEPLVRDLVLGQRGIAPVPAPERLSA